MSESEVNEPKASSSCLYCTFVGKGSSLGAARLERDRHMAFDCPATPPRARAKAERTIHWI